MKAALDHIVFAAQSLEEGTAWLEDRIGVPFSEGGEHAKMGTHNRLLRLGPHSYLEVIAINPDAERPACPRWFALDDPDMQSSLQTPRLIGWAVRTDNIKSASKLLLPAPPPIHPMSRGSLNWLITIPDNGGLLDGGVIPFLIEWQKGAHPAQNLPDRGISLVALELSTPNPVPLQSALQASDFDFASSPVRVVLGYGGARLTAFLDTPKGRLQFSSSTSNES